MLVFLLCHCVPAGYVFAVVLEHWFLGGWPLATSLHGQGGEYFFSHLLAFPPLITTEWNGAVTPDIGVSCASQDLGLAVWGLRPVK